MEPLPTPHNNFFRFTLSHLPSARSLIETQLSKAALAELDLETLRLLKYSRRGELAEQLRRILQSLLPSQGEDWFPELLEVIRVYIMSADNGVDDAQYEQTLKSVFPTQFERNSIAHRLLQRGRDEGRQEGEQLGLKKGEQLGLEKGEQLGLEKGEQLGLEKGEQLGLEKGELIGRISAFEELLGDPASPKSAMLGLDLNELKTKLSDLHQRLQDRGI